MIDDINVILPEIPVITLKDRKTKKQYNAELFVPTAVGIVLLEDAETIEKIFERKVDKNTVRLIFRIFEMILKPQHELMSAKWCEENIDLPTSIVLLVKIAKPLFEYIKILGAIPKRIETATPEKKPEEKDVITQ